jgi:hypothetical protein
VSKDQKSQVGRALLRLGIEHIAAYSPEARGRSERAFRTLQDQLPKVFRLAGITTVEAANAWLAIHYIAAYNRQFAIEPEDQETAFAPDRHEAWRETLCVIEERTVGNDNTIAWEGRRLQLPESRLRPHFVRAAVAVHVYPDATLSVFWGPHRLATFGADGELLSSPASSSLPACSTASRDGLANAKQEARTRRRPPLTRPARAGDVNLRAGAEKRASSRTKKQSKSVAVELATMP